jgi:hypothetical protein
MSKRDGEGSEDTGETVSETPENVVSIAPKGRPRAVPEPDAPAVPVSIFGAVPGAASYWAIRRQGLGGTLETLSYGAPGASAEVREWPIPELSEETIQKRWGAGTYQIEWLGVSATGGRKTVTRGRFFTLRPIEAPAPPPAAPASSLGEAFTLATQIMGMIEHNADRKVEGYATMAKLLGAGQSNGLGAAELTLILQKQAESTRDMVTSIVAPLQRDLAELRATKDEPSGGGVVAAAAGLVKGSGMGAQILNYAAANPEIVKTVLPVVSDMVGKLAAIFTPPAPPKFIPRATPEAAGAALAAAPMIAAALAPSSAPSQVAPGSLSAWESRTPEQPAEAPAAAAPDVAPS